MLTTQSGRSRLRLWSRLFSDQSQRQQESFVVFSTAATTQEQWTTGPRWTARFFGFVVTLSSFLGTV